MRKVDILSEATKVKRDKATGFPLVNKKDMETAITDVVRGLGGKVDRFEWLAAKPQSAPLTVVAHLALDLEQLDQLTKQSRYASTMYKWLEASVTDAIYTGVGYTNRSDQRLRVTVLQGSKDDMAAGKWAVRVEAPAYVAKFESMDAMKSIKGMTMRTLFERLEESK